MTRIWGVFIVFFALTSAVAQSTETRKVGKFSGVKTAEGVDVFLKRGDAEAVRVEVTGTEASNVITEISGSYLKIHMKDVGRVRNIDAKVYVTYVDIDRLSASSAGSIFSEEPIQARALEINVSSAGSVEIAVDAGSVMVSSSSAGDVELKGKTRKLTVEASSAGKVDAFDLEAEEVNAEASSAGSVKLNVRKSLTAHASSGGSIRYIGNPDRSNTNSSSGGSVKRSD
jgi:hypothetical protein